jgi:hypothetical protein
MAARTGVGNQSLPVRARSRWNALHSALWTWSQWRRWQLRPQYTVALHAVHERSVRASPPTCRHQLQVVRMPAPSGRANKGSEKVAMTSPGAYARVANRERPRLAEDSIRVPGGPAGTVDARELGMVGRKGKRRLVVKNVQVMLGA